MGCDGAKPLAAVQREDSPRPGSRVQTTMPVPSSPTVTRGPTMVWVAPGSDTCALAPKSAAPAGRAAASMTGRLPAPTFTRCQATSVVPAASTATAGNFDSSLSEERSTGVPKLPPAARVDSWTLNSELTFEICCHTIVAVPLPSTTTRGLVAFGWEIASGDENSPPGGRTEATTWGLPFVARVQAATSVPSGPAATSAPAALSARPGRVSGAIQPAAPATEGARQRAS